MDENATAPDREAIFTDLPPGEAVFTRVGDRVRVDRADPIIWISSALLEADNYESLVINGDLITMGDIGTVTYRITERHTRHVVAERVDTP